MVLFVRLTCTKKENAIILILFLQNWHKYCTCKKNEILRNISVLLWKTRLLVVIFEQLQLRFRQQ